MSKIINNRKKIARAIDRFSDKMHAKKQYLNRHPEVDVHDVMDFIWFDEEDIVHNVHDFNVAVAAQKRLTGRMRHHAVVRRQQIAKQIVQIVNTTR